MASRNTHAGKPQVEIVKRLIIFLLRIGLVTGLAFASGIGLTLFFQSNPLSNLLLERAIILLIVGLVAGLFSRIFMHKWHMFWKVLFSVLAAGCGLFILDRYFVSVYEDIFFKENWKDPIWIDLLQTGVSGLMAILAVTIGSPRRKIKAPTRTEIATAPARKTRQAEKPIRVKAKKNILKKKAQKTNLKKAISRKPVQAIKPVARRKTNKLKLGSSRGKSKDVRLLGETEHRCPYCLEEVVKNDPRGIVICPECKTWHHKDCWDVTGSCQVAHRHDL